MRALLSVTSGIINNTPATAHRQLLLLFLRNFETLRKLSARVGKFTKLLILARLFFISNTLLTFRRTMKNFTQKAYQRYEITRGMNVNLLEILRNVKRSISDEPLDAPSLNISLEDGVVLKPDYEISLRYCPLSKSVVPLFLSFRQLSSGTHFEDIPLNFVYDGSENGSVKQQRIWFSKNGNELVFLGEGSDMGTHLNLKFIVPAASALFEQMKPEEAIPQMIAAVTNSLTLRKFTPTPGTHYLELILKCHNDYQLVGFLEWEKAQKYLLAK